MQVGDTIQLNPAHFPNAGYRFGDNPSMNVRVMQIIRRTESPAGPLLKLLDGGSITQPATTPTVTVAQSPSVPRSIAVATITNALNAHMCHAQTATQRACPRARECITAKRFASGACPTVAFNLPNAPPHDAHVRNAQRAPAYADRICRAGPV